MIKNYLNKDFLSDIQADIKDLKARQRIEKRLDAYIQNAVESVLMKPKTLRKLKRAIKEEKREGKNRS